MTIRYFARDFIGVFPPGTIVTKDKFVNWLELNGLLEPVEDPSDFNQVSGYEQNIHRLRNQINDVSVTMEQGYRIDVHERGQTLIVRTLKDVILHESDTFIRKMTTRIKNKLEEIQFLAFSAAQERKWTNREKDQMMRHFEGLTDDLDLVVERLNRMERRHKEREKA